VLAENPKRASGGDFRASRVAAEQIKRAQSSDRNIAPEKRVSLREPARNAQSVGSRESERVQSMRGVSRPPVQALQGSPSTESRSNQSGSNEVIRRSRETPDQRDTFQRDNSRREVREQPRAREWSRPERQAAPVERRESAPVMRSQPRVEQSQPRIERRSEPREVRSSPPPQMHSSPPPASSPRQHSDQGSSRNSGGNDNSAGSRDRPNRRPD
jgi:hypothetical protein